MHHWRIGSAQDHHSRATKGQMSRQNSASVNRTISGSGRTKERRRHARVAVTLTAKRQDGVGQWQTRDISEGGLSLIGNSAVAVGDKLDLALWVPTPGGIQNQVVARAEVVRVEAGSTSLRFVELLSEDRKAVGELVDRLRLSESRVSEIEGMIAELIDPADESAIPVPASQAMPSAASVAPATSEASDSKAACVGEDGKLPDGCRLGEYRIVRWLGSGGMGHVYLAEHVRTGRRVAIKRLHSEVAVDESSVKRFFAEVRAVGRIRHENIVQVHDLVAEPGHTYCVMEWLEGVTLAVLQTQRGVLPLKRALRIGAQVCRALQAVHSAGVVHRDLKPENIIVTERGDHDEVKLLDFGISKLYRTEDVDPQTNVRTGAGIVLGTPGYMAPEQLTGGRVDQRADLYALGVILYQIMTGTNPFVADTWGEVMRRHANVTPTRPSKVKTGSRRMPAGVDRIVLRCLAKDPEDRPDSALQVEEELSGILKGDLVVASSPRRIDRGRVVTGIVSATIAVVAVLTLTRVLAVTQEAAPMAQDHEQQTPDLDARQSAPSAPATASTSTSGEPVASNPAPTAALQGTRALSTTADRHPSKSAQSGKGKPKRMLDEPGTLSADEYFQEGLTQMRAKNPSAAADALRKCVAANPRYAQAYGVMGQAYVMLGKEAAAVSAFEKFVSLAPNAPEAAKLREVIEAYRSSH